MGLTLLEGLGLFFQDYGVRLILEEVHEVFLMRLDYLPRQAC